MSREVTALVAKAMALGGVEMVVGLGVVGDQAGVEVEVVVEVGLVEVVDEDGEDVEVGEVQE